MRDECRGVVYACGETLLVGGQSLQFTQQVPHPLQLKGSQMKFNVKLFITASLIPLFPLLLQLLDGWIRAGRLLQT